MDPVTAIGMLLLCLALVLWSVSRTSPSHPFASHDELTERQIQIDQAHHLEML